MTHQDILERFGPRESMAYDVVVVGGGPAGLATAIRLKQLAAENGGEVSVVVLEKGAGSTRSCGSRATSSCGSRRARG